NTATSSMLASVGNIFATTAFISFGLHVPHEPRTHRVVHADAARFAKPVPQAWTQEMRDVERTTHRRDVNRELTSRLCRTRFAPSRAPPTRCLIKHLTHTPPRR